MAKVIIVPTEDYNILKKYFGASREGCLVLVPEKALNSFSTAAQARCRKLAAKSDVQYDFGGEPDVCIDLILCEDSYAYGALLYESEMG